MNQEHHHMAQVAEASQVLQRKFVSYHIKLIDRLLKDYRDKKKNEHKIIVKVDGKVKFKAVVDKNGKLNIKRNTLTVDEVQALQSYFKMMHNPPIQPKDFDVSVDGNRVLLTQNGQLVEKAQPHPEAVDSIDAEPTLTRETPEAVEPTEPETQNNDADSDSDESETESATPTTPTDEIDSTETPEPTQAREAQQPQSQQLPLLDLTAPRSPEGVPQISETGIVPQDYGLGKVITDGAIVATGDRALVSAHGGLEAKRLELNDCVRRGVEPGFSYLNERATVLRTEINRDLPKFSELLNESIAQGKYSPAQRSAPGLDRDMPMTPKKQQTQAPSQAQEQVQKRVLAKR